MTSAPDHLTEQALAQIGHLLLSTIAALVGAVALTASGVLTP